MRFRSNIIFLIGIILLFSSLSLSYGATEWNIISELDYSGLVIPADADTPFAAVVGDFIGDTNDDIAIGDLVNDKVYILAGDGTSFSSVPTVTIDRAPAAPVEFGGNLAKLSDLDGDGKDELVVSSRGEGTVFIFRSGELILAGAAVNALNDSSAMIEGLSGSTTYGTNLGGAGDVDGDNLDELLISDDFTSGTVDIYLGSSINAAISADAPALPTHISSASSDGTYTGAGGQDFGRYIGSAGDLNGDGYDEVIITNPTGNPVVASGIAYIYLGGATIDTTYDLPIAGTAYYNLGSGTYSETAFGYSAATVFDIDNDGYDDLLLGAPTAGPGGAGVAYLYFGNPTDILELREYPVGSGNFIPDFVEYFGEGSSSDKFGLNMASFNANSDAYDDIVIGAPRAKSDSTGRVYYVAGNTRASLDGSFTDVMVGSYALDLTGNLVGENLGFITIANGSDLYLATFVSKLLKHCAITTTPPYIIGGVLSSNMTLDTSINGGTYYVRKDIIVPKGVTLTINEGVSLLFNPTKFDKSGFSHEHLELNVFGRLVINGTLSSRVNIAMNRDPSIDSPGGWLGINLEDNSSAVIRYANIKYGLNGIWVDRASLTLENSTIEYNGGEFIPLSDCDQNFTCSPDVGNGLYVKSGIMTPLVGCVLSNNEARGLVIEAPDNADSDPANVLDRIEGNTISNNGGGGISINDSELRIPSILNNKILDNGGSGLIGVIDSIISGNEVNGNSGDGINADQSTIIGNWLNGNDFGIFASESDISDNEIVRSFTTGASISEGTFTNNYVGVKKIDPSDPNAPFYYNEGLFPFDPDSTPNTYGVDASGRVDISQNYIYGNLLDGITWDSNSYGTETPGILWQNTINLNGDSGIVLLDASPYITGNNITGNGHRGAENYDNGIRLDTASRPRIIQNNLNNNYNQALRLTHTAPGNLNETYTLSASGNWWGFTDLNNIYGIIWDSGDDISLLGTVLVSPASSQVDIATVSKPKTGGKAQKSIISCFVASASYGEVKEKQDVEEKSLLKRLLKSFDNAFFKE